MIRLRNPKVWLARSTAFVAVAALVAVGASSVSSGATTARSLKPQASHGTASVACAGSLLKLYYDTLGPAFKAETGDNWGGPPCAGSLALSAEIASGEISPGVFLSIGAKGIKKLFPSGKAKFAMAVASDPLVIGFSHNSRYYSELNAIKTHRKPLSDLFTLFNTPGFKLGRTDPTQDTQGVFFILMAKLAQKVLSLPAGEAAAALGITKSSPIGSSSQQYSETALPTDIATGIVDAGSEYLPEAKQYGLDYITLPPSLDFASPAESALYSTVGLTVSGSVDQGEVIYLNIGLIYPKQVASAANEAADQAFVAFMLKHYARTILKGIGYELHPPVLHLATGLTAAEALPGPIFKLFKSLGGTISS